MTWPIIASLRRLTPLFPPQVLYPPGRSEQGPDTTARTGGNTRSAPGHGRSCAIQSTTLTAAIAGKPLYGQAHTQRFEQRCGAPEVGIPTQAQRVVQRLRIQLDLLHEPRRDES